MPGKLREEFHSLYIYCENIELRGEFHFLYCENRKLRSEFHYLKCDVCMKCLLGGHPALLRTSHLQFPVELRVSFMTIGMMEGSFRDHRLGFFYRLFFLRFITHGFGFGTLLGICFGSLSIEIAVDNVYGEGEDDGGVLFCRDGV